MKTLCISLGVILIFNCCNSLSIYEQLSALNATTFLSVVNKSGLVQQLSTQGQWTVLVPTDAAFAKIPAHDLNAVINNANLLTETLKYHIISGNHYTSEFLFIKHYFLNSTNGHVLRVQRNSASTGFLNLSPNALLDVLGNDNLYSTNRLNNENRNHGMFFNQAKAIKSNINATNGVIYLIDEVLDVPEGTVTDILANPGYNISMFLQMVKLSTLDQQYSIPAGLNRYTVFAPNDDAIQAIPPSVKTHILHDFNYAKAFVEYHVHSGTTHASSIAKYRSIRTTYPGHSLQITHLADGSIKLNNIAQILLPDIEAENGVVHVISHALIPPPETDIVG